MGNEELRGERAPGVSVRGEGTLGHLFGRHASMHEEKSRGSSLESRKTRVGRYGLRDPRGGSRSSSGKRGWQASSGHGTVQDRARWTPKGRI
ncbi:hypothetical protein CRG98_001214 [Punica granatum]|uniref:Uncharacterized protein n=1 Tax=Punica granatum TaxID=22663 RepID=A0A2I0LCJ8_PUNGR|nr:hypothetical protein CRG98_001214 [Punica granatum]